MELIDEQFVDGFVERLCSSLMLSYCETAQEAEQSADRLAASLGLEKTAIEQAYTFCYQDTTRNVRLEVQICYTNFHGHQNCWAFSCSAGRVGDSFNISPEHSYRKITSYFRGDAKAIVNLVLAGEIEHRKRLAEKIAALQKADPDLSVGTLKAWSKSKTYGFLTYTSSQTSLANGAILVYAAPSDIFVHIRDVKPSTRPLLQIGQTFSFKREYTAKGWKAVQVRHIS